VEEKKDKKDASKKEKKTIKGEQLLNLNIKKIFRDVFFFLLKFFIFLFFDLSKR
jgi:hypothetical protein